VWECDGRVGVSVYGEDPTAQCGVWVDVEGDWVYSVGDVCGGVGVWAAEEGGEEEGAAVGCERV